MTNKLRPRLSESSKTEGSENTSLSRFFLGSGQRETPFALNLVQAVTNTNLVVVQVHSKTSQPSLIDIAGVISSIAEQTFYIEKFRKWIGKDLNFRSLSKNGNGSTAGKLKFGLKWSKNFNWIQKRLAMLSALQSINAYNNGEINVNMLAYSLGSTTYSVDGGMYGTGWGTGQLIGKGIASFLPYLRNIRPLLRDLLRM